MRSRWLVLIAVGFVLPVAACSGDYGAEPTLESINFTPRLTVEVDDAGFEVTATQNDDPAITTDPPTAPEGTVIEIRNTGSTDHRVTNNGTVDTGILHPGDTTTVVLTTEGDLELQEAETGATLTVVVTARQG